MNTQKWLKKLLGSVIQGASHAGSAYLGLALAHAADTSIPALNIKGLFVIVCSSAVLKFFQFLDANPLPDEEVTVTQTQTTEIVTKTTPHEDIK